jgi:hypothetical protein
MPISGAIVGRTERVACETVVSGWVDSFLIKVVESVAPNHAFKHSVHVYKGIGAVGVVAGYVEWCFDSHRREKADDVSNHQFTYGSVEDGLRKAVNHAVDHFSTFVLRGGFSEKSRQGTTVANDLLEYI